MAIHSGSRTHIMREECAIVALPGSPMQDLSAQSFQVTGIRIANINNEGCARTEVSTYSCKRLLLLLAHGNVPERTQCNEGQTKFLSQLQGAYILLYQLTAEHAISTDKGLTSQL